MIEVIKASTYLVTQTAQFFENSVMQKGTYHKQSRFLHLLRQSHS